MRCIGRTWSKNCSRKTNNLLHSWLQKQRFVPCIPYDPKKSVIILGAVLEVVHISESSIYRIEKSILIYIYSACKARVFPECRIGNSYFLHSIQCKSFLDLLLDVLQAGQAAAKRNIEKMSVLTKWRRSTSENPSGDSDSGADGYHFTLSKASIYLFL